MSNPTTNSHDDVVEALRVTAAALQCLVRLIPHGERHIINFTGEWLHLAPRSVGTILDHANAALEPYPYPLRAEPADARA
jgi:hypothetical protein